MKRRVIIDNDFAGDPDDLFQLVHHLLSPSVDIRGIIGSHLAPGDFLDGSADTAGHAVQVVRQVLDLMGLQERYPVLQGANQALASLEPQPHSAASRFIVEEACREPAGELYVVCGGGLTDVALALINNPEIAGRLTVVWIGGPEHGRRPAGPVRQVEYNLNIDLLAARYLFNQTRVELWQVPRDVYRQCQVSLAELRQQVLPCGPIGQYLYDALLAAMQKFGSCIPLEAETWILGDQPLVLLTALLSFFDPAASSCHHRLERHVRLDRHGQYAPRLTRRSIKVFETVDTRLMFTDFYAKLGQFRTQDL